MGKENMIKRLKEINNVLPELLAGILLIGVVCEIIGVCLVTDKAGYSIGLFIGVLLAAGTAVHMAWSLDIALDTGGLGAEKKIRTGSFVRYGIIVIIFVVVALTKIGNPLAAFLGIMTLKAGAYLQPLIHKLNLKLQYHVRR